MIQQLKNKKILITGGTGFIGKKLVERLEKNNIESYVLTRRKILDSAKTKYIQCDLNTLEKYPDELKEMKFDYCIYLAANIPTIGEKKENYLEAKNSTLDPLIKFLTYFKKNIKKFIYTSSIDILGKVQKLNYKEDEIPNNPTPYGLAKYCGEFYVQNICETEGINWSILRFSQVYGKNEPIVRIIPILIERIKEEQEFTLFTTGEEKRRFLHVSDAVNGIICACLNGKQSIYNIAGEDIKSINEVIKIIEENFEKKLKLNKLDKINGVDNIPNIDKAKSELNYKPEYILEKGIQALKNTGFPIEYEG